MKRFLQMLLTVGLLGTLAEADVLRVEAGVGIWNQDPEGHIQYQDLPLFSNSDVGYSDENRVYAWVNIKHPVPVLPNIRLEYTPMEFAGTSTATFQYNNTEFTSGAKSTLTIEQYDAVLYYNILDNTGWTTVDLGLDAKYIDTRFNASGQGRTVVPLGSLVVHLSLKASLWSFQWLMQESVFRSRLLISVLRVMSNMQHIRVLMFMIIA